MKSQRERTFQGRYIYMYLEKINSEKQNKVEKLSDAEMLRLLDDEPRKEVEPVKTEIEPEPKNDNEIENRVFANRMFGATDSNNFIAFNKTMMKVLRKLKLTGNDWNLITYLFEMTCGMNFTLIKPQGKKIKSRRAPGIKKKDQNWIYPKAIKDNTGIDRTNLYRNINKLEKMKIIKIHQKATKSRPYKIEFNIRWDKWNINKDIIRMGLEDLNKISEKPKK
jgi:DNA-binding MarR family transcriptional regulator